MYIKQCSSVLMSLSHLNMFTLKIIVLCCLCEQILWYIMHIKLRLFFLEKFLSFCNIFVAVSFELLFFVNIIRPFNFNNIYDVVRKCFFIYKFLVVYLFTFYSNMHHLLYLTNTLVSLIYLHWSSRYPTRKYVITWQLM